MAGAIGWALFHSLWQGAILSVVFAAVLLAVRSPRVRYAAACAAMLAGFGLTLLRLLPAQGGGARNVHAPMPYLANLSLASVAANGWIPSLAAIAPWLGPFWITGVCLFCLWYSASWVSAERMRRRGVCCASAHWQGEIARLRTALRVSRPVLLLKSCLADVPVVLGHFRPELAYIRRRDYLMNVLQRLAEGLLFYHPAVWWFSGVMRNEREKCCDDLVVSATSKAHEYALALAALEQNRFSGRQPAMAVTGGNLMKRIHRRFIPNLRALPGRRCSPWPFVLSPPAYLGRHGNPSPRKTAPPLHKHKRAAPQLLPIPNGQTRMWSTLFTMRSVPPFKSSLRISSGTTLSSSSGSVAILLRAPRPTSLKKSTSTGLTTPTSIFGQRPAPRAGRPIAATCSSSMARRTRSTPPQRAADATRNRNLDVPPCRGSRRQRIRYLHRPDRAQRLSSCAWKRALKLALAESKESKFAVRALATP
jgi:BlaR1 peptidase M56